VRVKLRSAATRVPALGAVLADELLVYLHVCVALNLVADRKEIVDLRTLSPRRAIQTLRAALRRAVIAGDLLKVVADQTDVELFGKEGGRARVEMSVEAVLISRRRIGEDVCHSNQKSLLAPPIAG
jgi:hypothetical protein